MKSFYTILFVLGVSFPIFSQEEGTAERIKTLKIGYITEKINLTAAEAKNFWLVYDKYAEILHDLQCQARTCRKKGCEKKENLTEKEALDILKKDSELMDKIWQTNKEKDKELLKVISARKLLLLKDAEKEFHRKLMKQYKEAK